MDNENRNVLVRFIVPDSEEIRDDIIFATNNQTNIPKSSLRVTDAIHLQIEMYCKTRGLYYDRRKNYYKNLKKKATDIISVSFLAQCLISLFLRKPDFARARPSTLLTDDRTYNQLYPKNCNLSVYYKVGKLGKIIQDNLRKTPDWNPSEKNDILFYVLYGVVVKLLGKTDIKPIDIVNFDLNLVLSYSIGRHMVNQLESTSLAFVPDPLSDLFVHPLLVDYVLVPSLSPFYKIVPSSYKKKGLK